MRRFGFALALVVLLGLAHVGQLQAAELTFEGIIPQPCITYFWKLAHQGETGCDLAPWQRRFGFLCTPFKKTFERGYQAYQGALKAEQEQKTLSEKMAKLGEEGRYVRYEIGPKGTPRRDAYETYKDEGAGQVTKQRWNQNYSSLEEARLAKSWQTQAPQKFEAWRAYKNAGGEMSPSQWQTKYDLVIDPSRRMNLPSGVADGQIKRLRSDGEHYSCWGWSYAKCDAWVKHVREGQVTKADGTPYTDLAGFRTADTHNVANVAQQRQAWATAYDQSSIGGIIGRTSTPHLQQQWQTYRSEGGTLPIDQWFYGVALPYSVQTSMYQGPRDEVLHVLGALNKDAILTNGRGHDSQWHMIHGLYTLTR